MGVGFDYVSLYDGSEEKEMRNAVFGFSVPRELGFLYHSRLN